MKIAITLVHQESDVENEAQISTILGLVDRVTDTNEEFDAEGNSLGFFDTYHYEIKGLGMPHEVKFYHVIPYGFDPPSNLDQLDGHKVFYGPEYQMNEKRFFDWGLKRGTDHGADVSLYVEDLSKLKFNKILSKLQKVANKTDSTDFEQDAGGKIANLEYLKKGGLR